MPQPPNILFITADDMDGTTPGAFGGPDGVTPALDALAAQGAVFDRAHVAIAVCQPSRSAIMTGRWPHRNGAEGFEPVRADVPLLTSVLAAEGYAVGILGKVAHLQPVERFGWDTAVDMAELGMGRDPERYADEMRGFLAGAAGRPWFLMVNAHDPHRPFHGADDVARFFDDQQRAGIPAPSRVFAPGEAQPPGYLPDLPPVRTEYAQYLSSARRCDDVVRAALGVLDEASAADNTAAADNTLVVFLSDNGMAFPFAKANCYLQSTRTPLVVRWPGRVAAGRRESAAFVSVLDLFATFCEVAGADAPESDGASLVPLLTGTGPGGGDHVVTVFHETAMKGRYEMRCVQDGAVGYVWNGWADGEHAYRAENMTGLTWAAMVEAAGSDPELAERVASYQRRPAEELYDLREDPHSLRNLAGDPARAGDLDDKRRALHAWMAATDDPQLAAYERLLGGHAPDTVTVGG
jgi:N-sulfoglucosamine sulfohydrolase